MTTYILDTGIVVGYARATAYAKYAEERFAFATPSNISLISVVTVGEIYSIALQSAWGDEKRAALDRLLEVIPWVDISSRQVLGKYAEIDAYSQCRHPALKSPNFATPRNMRKNDLWIAATASVLNATLLTTDHDFDHLSDHFLKVAYIDPNMKAS